MKAVIFRGIGDTRLDNVSEPKPIDSPDGIVRLSAGANCGTDLRMVRGTSSDTEPGTSFGNEGVDVGDAYETFDLRQSGWIKVELKPFV